MQTGRAATDFDNVKRKLKREKNFTTEPLVTEAIKKRHRKS
jgi:hypothetical protein